MLNFGTLDKGINMIWSNTYPKYQMTNIEPKLTLEQVFLKELQQFPRRTSILR